MRSASPLGRRLARLAGGAGLLAVAGMLYLLVRYLEQAGPAFVANRLLLPALSIAIVVLILGLAAVLVRNLVRLVMDRKRGILGARLRTKLVFFFLALVLPSAFILFYGSATIIKMTVEAMLRTPIERIITDTQGVAQQWTAHLMRDCETHARRLAANAGALGPETLEAARQEAELALLAVVPANGPPRIARDAVWAARLAPSTSWRELAREALTEGRAKRRLEQIGGGLLAQAAVPLPHGQGAVVAGAFLAPAEAARLESIAATAEAYRQFRAQRRELVALYLSLIGLIFLVTVFGATWVGFYLSRRITDPVRELAAAAREISGGNLAVRVRAQVGDELGELVRAFNEMAAQLQESQEVIRRSTAELRRSMGALEERRRYIETLVANLSTGVLSLDPQGRVTTVNPAVERILGVALQLRDAARERLQAAGHAPLVAVLDEATRSGRQTAVRQLTLHRGDEAIAVAVQVSPLRGPEGAGLGTLVMIEDLTDLLRAQRAAAWREVARRIAHEIKNPLTPIQLAAQRLRRKFRERAPDLGEVIEQASASIEREVAGLKRLVDEFSRFARMPEVAPEAVDFRQVVRSVLDLYGGLPEVEWEVHFDEGVGVVRVDPEQMRRVLINLIDNAVRAMEGKGRIRIAASCPRGPGSLRVEVADTGPGISPAVRAKLFVPGFSGQPRGGGLGLAIVHRVVTDHRGSIRVEDNEPRGAKFVIEIPA